MRSAWSIALGLGLLAVSAAQAGDPSADAITAICGAETRPMTTTGPLKLEITPGMGSGGFAVRTTSPGAQGWFDHGIKLFHAFYHEEARVAFDKAAEADPACMMCVWGQALSRGPNQNFDTSPEDITEALTLAQRAQSMAVTDEEKALAAALTTRLAGKLNVKTERAFAEALERRAKANTANTDLAILAAHAWLTAGRRGYGPAPDRAIALIEPVLRARPDDTGAIHYYIHATEWDGRPGKAEPYADKLAGLAPKASHLVHMAAHTYIRVGRYHDAAIMNARALKVDNDELTAINKPGYAGSEALYYGHNFSVGLAGALLAGAGPLAVRFADHLPKAWPGSQFKDDEQYGERGRSMIALGLYAPDRMLALAEPDKGEPGLREVFHYARGEALAARGDQAGVETEARALSATSLPGLILQGRLAMLKGDTKTAIAKYQQAARQQERAYGGGMDPPPWWYPARRSLAAAKLKAGDARGAASEARKVLDGWPKEPLTLLVLSQAEAAMGQARAAEDHRRQAQGQWRGNLAAVKLETV